MEAESVLCFTIGWLRDLLVQEGVYLPVLKGPVDELIEMLTRTEDLLEYGRVRRDKRTEEIIEFADHLIDSVEEYVFRALSGYMGIRKHFLRPKVLMAIEKITTKINELVDSQSGLQSNDDAPRREYKVQDLSGFVENDFIGREEDISKLVSFLVDEESEQRVISLYGMGGLGKTTHARKVYRDEKVLGHFQSFAFVCVSEQCQAEEILKHILQQLLPEKKEDDINGMTDGDVIDLLQRVQEEKKKCLVVIDDVWSVCDWERLNRGLPDGCTGSKVLLTTWIKDVVDKGFCYSLPCLSEEECWNLFKKKIFTGRGQLNIASNICSSTVCVFSTPSNPKKETHFINAGVSSLAQLRRLAYSPRLAHFHKRPSSCFVSQARASILRLSHFLLVSQAHASGSLAPQAHMRTAQAPAVLSGHQLSPVYFRRAPPAGSFQPGLLSPARILSL